MPNHRPLAFHHTEVAPQAIERVVEVLKSGWLNEGAVTKEFEEQLALRLGLVNPVSLNSGTSALHLALLVAGVKAGDEVVIPAQTFVATGTTVLMCGARPVFSDIDPTTGELWGNFPQTYSMVGIIVAAMRLSKGWESAR